MDTLISGTTTRLHLETKLQSGCKQLLQHGRSSPPSSVCLYEASMPLSRGGSLDRLAPRCVLRAPALLCSTLPGSTFRQEGAFCTLCTVHVLTSCMHGPLSGTRCNKWLHAIRTQRGSSKSCFCGLCGWRNCGWYSLALLN